LPLFFFLSFLSLGSCCSPLATASVVVVEASTGFSDCAEAFGTLADFSD
jgi:hypothetical protein